MASQIELHINDREPRTETSAVYLTEPYRNWPTDDLIKAANLMAQVHYDVYKYTKRLTDDFSAIAEAAVNQTLTAYNDLIIDFFNSFQIRFTVKI